jgi:hypothetical protein
MKSRYDPTGESFSISVPLRPLTPQAAASIASRERRKEQGRAYYAKNRERFVAEARDRYAKKRKPGAIPWCRLPQHCFTPRAAPHQATPQPPTQPT